jgi:hypothetical protein
MNINLLKENAFTEKYGKPSDWLGEPVPSFFKYEEKITEDFSIHKTIKRYAKGILVSFHGITIILTDSKRNAKKFISEIQQEEFNLKKPENFVAYLREMKQIMIKKGI